MKISKLFKALIILVISAFLLLAFWKLMNLLFDDFLTNFSFANQILTYSIIIIVCLLILIFFGHGLKKITRKLW